MNNRKLFFGIMAMVASLLAAHAQSATAMAFPQTAAALPSDPNLLYAMYGQVLNNPSSLFVIAFLCILAWLADDLPFIPSKYVQHLTVIMGASIYWAFTSEETVPKSFPNPHAVFIVNGTICGFVAYVIHRQAVSRLINLVRGAVIPTTGAGKAPPAP